MQTFNFPNKNVVNPRKLQSDLQSSGYTGAIVTACESTPPSAVIYEANGAPNPTTFVNAYVDPPVITATSNKPNGVFDIPQGLADGADTQVITIQLKDPYTGQNVGGNQTIGVYPHTPLPVSSTSVTLVNGSGTFTAGPTTVPGEYDIFMKFSTDTTGYSWLQYHIAFF